MITITLETIQARQDELICAQLATVTAERDDLRAQLAEAQKDAEPAAQQGDNIAVRVCRSVAELPDRDSPEGWPEAMLVTHEELHAIVLGALNDDQPTTAATQGEPSEYPPEFKTEGEHKAYCFGWWKALEVNQRANTTDATLHKIIASVEAALDAAGAPAGKLVERIGALGEDAARLDWLGNQFVTVRVPLRYGSKECFMGSPTDKDREFIPWNIRAAIDAAKGEKNGA